ncbi:MAG: OmpA family protein [Flavobacteriales bacterium]|nr:OmpA family protein [Flavobacteriales bacterium]
METINQPQKSDTNITKYQNDFTMKRLLKTLSLFVLLTSVVFQSYGENKTFSVYFDNNASQIGNTQAEVIASIPEIVSDKLYEISIQGFADTNGSIDYNNQLSLNRANALRNFLTMRGINPAAINVVGNGEVNTANGLNYARRVDITIQITSPEELLNKNDIQGFKINPRKSNVIRGKKGTEVYLPANAFVLKNGSPVFGNVDVELKEFYELSDYVQSGLHTATHEGTLESGGTIYLNASANGKPVYPRTALEVRMPSNNLKDGMNVYYATGSSVTPEGLWALDSNSSSNKIDTVNVRVDYQHAIKLLGSRFSLGKEYLQKAGILANKEKQGRLLIHLLRSENESLTEKVCDLFDVNEITAFNRHYVKDKTDTSKSILKGSGRPIYKASTQRRVKMKDYLGEGYEMKEINKVYVTYKDDSSEETDLLANQARNIRNYRYYRLRASNLGWINCDRFRTSEPRVVVKADSHKEKVDFCALVFPDLNSIMAGTVYSDGIIRFGGVPKNKKAYLVSYAMKNGEIRFSKQPIKADDDLKSIEYTTISKEDFQGQMSAFAKL